MKPISRLRMRARSESVSDSAGLPFKRVLALGRRVEQAEDREQRRLAAARRARRSRRTRPWAISRCTPESACVSTSSVKKTFVTPSSLMTGCPLALMRCPLLHFKRTRSCASHALMSERITLSPGLRPSRISTVFTELLPSLTLTRTASSPSSFDPEEADEALLLPEGGPSDVEHVLQAVELDRAVDGEVRPRALRQLALEGHVDGDRAVLRGRVDARDLARARCRCACRSRPAGRSRRPWPASRRSSAAP